mgnify:CR=1 FL=1
MPIVIARVSKSRRAAWLVALVGLCAGTASGAGDAGIVKLDVALVPDANLVLRVDSGAARQAPFYQALRKQDSTRDDGAGRSEEADVLSDFGLAQDDIGRVLLSADLSKLEGGASPALFSRDVEGVAAVELDKSVSLADVGRALRRRAREQGDDVRIERTRYKAVPVLVAQSVARNHPRRRGEPGVRIAVATRNGGKLLLFGTEVGLEGALDRALTGGDAAPRKGTMARLLGRVEKDPQLLVAFVLTPSMREALRSAATGKRAGQGEEKPANPAVRTIAQAGSRMAGCRVSAEFAEDVRLALHLVFEDEQTAAEVKGVIAAVRAELAPASTENQRAIPASEIDAGEARLTQNGRDLFWETRLTPEEFSRLTRAARVHVLRLWLASMQRSMERHGSRNDTP